MIITICGSMVFTEKMLEAQEELEKLGHEVFVSGFAQSYVGLEDKEKERLAVIEKVEHDAMIEHWKKIQKSDAILVLNYDKRGIKNYVGGNTLIEMGFAYVLGKRIFMLNPIPDIDFYRSEIEAVKPVIIDGDFSKVV